MKFRKLGLEFVHGMDRINDLMLKLCGLLFAIMVVVIFFAICIRFFIAGMGVYISAPWTEELARFLLIWAAFIAGGIGTRTGELIGVDIVVDHLPRRLGISAKYLCHALSIAFYVALVVIGWEWSQFGMMDFSPVMGIPKLYINAAMVVGGLLMVLNTLALMVMSWVEQTDIRHPFKRVEDGATTQDVNQPLTGA